MNPSSLMTHSKFLRSLQEKSATITMNVNKTSLLKLAQNARSMALSLEQEEHGKVQMN